MVNRLSVVTTLTVLFSSCNARTPDGAHHHPMRAMHLGNYGADFDDPFSTEYLGHPYHPAYVRRYGFGSFAPEECPSDRDDCPVIDRLRGTHIAVANLELRLPFLGTDRFGLTNFPYLPTDLSVFADAGVAWTSEEAPTFELTSTFRCSVWAVPPASTYLERSCSRPTSRIHFSDRTAAGTSASFSCRDGNPLAGIKVTSLVRVRYEVGSEDLGDREGAPDLPIPCGRADRSRAPAARLR